MAAIVHPQLAPSWDGTPLRLVRAPAAPPYAARRLAAAVVLVLALLVGVSAVRAAAPPVTAAVGAVVGAVAGPPPALPAPLAAPASGGVHVVTSGDTYWSVAVSLRAGGDVRALVDELVAVNGGRLLQPGDRLVLPFP